MATLTTASPTKSLNQESVEHFVAHVLLQRIYIALKCRTHDDVAAKYVEEHLIKNFCLHISYGDLDLVQQLNRLLDSDSYAGRL